MKKIVVSLVVLFTIGLTAPKVLADEQGGQTLTETINFKETKRIGPDFDLSQKFSQTEIKLLKAAKEELGFNFNGEATDEYLEFLNDLAYSDKYVIGKNESENIEFTSFASNYQTRLSDLFYSLDATSFQTERNQLLNKTYLEVREENKQALLNADYESQLKRAAPQLRSAPFNYAKGTTYALKYALTPNSSYEVFSNGDCTNFTSQIAFAGGKKKVWAANPSGYPWYWDKKGVYSRSWTVAFTFAQYWTADGAITLNYNDKASAQKGMTEGAFVAYWEKNTFNIGHMSYVSQKKNGKAYISQHSTNRKNTAWDSINTSAYSSFIVMKI